MKTIEICGKEYKLECNALTPLKYNSFFNRGLIKDTEALQEYFIKQVIIKQQVDAEKISDAEKIDKISSYMRDYVDEFILNVERVTWILIYTANPNIENFEKWLEGINLKVNDSWIAEVTEFAVDCFC